MGQKQKTEKKHLVLKFLGASQGNDKNEFKMSTHLSSAGEKNILQKTKEEETQQPDILA